MSSFEVLPDLGYVFGIGLGLPAGWVATYFFGSWATRHHEHQKALNLIKQKQARDMADESIRVAKLHNDHTIAQMLESTPGHSLELDGSPRVVTRLAEPERRPRRR